MIDGTSSGLDLASVARKQALVRIQPFKGTTAQYYRTGKKSMFVFLLVVRHL
jgi:hypothetical protein